MSNFPLVPSQSLVHDIEIHTAKDFNVYIYIYILIVVHVVFSKRFVLPVCSEAKSKFAAVVN